MRFRAILGVFLALLLAATGLTGATARGQMAAGIALCGPSTSGEPPAGAPDHLCPDCVLSHLPVALPPSGTLPVAVAGALATFVAPSAPAVPAGHRPQPDATGPPSRV